MSTFLILLIFLLYLFFLFVIFHFIIVGIPLNDPALILSNYQLNQLYLFFSFHIYLVTDQTSISCNSNITLFKSYDWLVGRKQKKDVLVYYTNRVLQTHGTNKIRDELFKSTMKFPSNTPRVMSGRNRCSLPWITDGEQFWM